MSAKSVILVVDDERAQAIADLIELEFPAFTIECCSTTKDAKAQVQCLEQAIVAAVFDSGFDRNRLAGCTLYRELSEARTWLRNRSIFHTAFDSDVHRELVPQHLDSSNLITKGILSPRALIEKLKKIVRR